jgi:hypothetical protein
MSVEMVPTDQLEIIGDDCISMTIRENERQVVLAQHGRG